MFRLLCWGLLLPRHASLDSLGTLDKFFKISPQTPPENGKLFGAKTREC